MPVEVTARTAPARAGRWATCAVVGVIACTPDAPPGETGPRTPFALDSAVVGSVAENATDCVVDATCALLIAFEDTTVLVVYGTGERPAPTCSIPATASDAAFAVEAGQLVRVVVGACDDVGLYLESLRILPGPT